MLKMKMITKIAKDADDYVDDANNDGDADADDDDCDNVDEDNDEDDDDDDEVYNHGC